VARAGGGVGVLLPQRVFVLVLVALERFLLVRRIIDLSLRKAVKLRFDDKLPMPSRWQSTEFLKSNSTLRINVLPHQILRLQALR